MYQAVFIFVPTIEIYGIYVEYMQYKQCTNMSDVEQHVLKTLKTKPVLIYYIFTHFGFHTCRVMQSTIQLSK